jgi:ParB family chromosome partitioning protein
MIGLKEVPVIIEEIKKEEELPISLVENLQREDLNSLEKAKAFKRLIEEFHLTQKEIGKMVGKSRETVTNTLRLLDLPGEIKKAIEKGEISESHAKALLSVSKGEQMKVYKEVIQKKLPVREVEKKAKIRKEKIKKEKIKKEGKNLQKLENEISKVLKIKNIKVKEVNDQLELTLIFQSEKDLKKFLKKIKLS